MINSSETLQFKFARPWRARDEAELLGLLQEEAEIWRSYEDADMRLNQGYANFSVDLAQFDNLETDQFSPSNIKNFLPPSASPTGSLFLDALKEGDKERYGSLVYAFFVANGWVASPFLVTNAVHGSNFRYRESFDQYLRGLALLGGAVASSNPDPLGAVNLSSDKVKTQLSSLKSDMSRKSKLLQNELAKARAEVSKLRRDRKKIRLIAASGYRIANNRFISDKERWNKNFSDIHDVYTKQLEYKAAVELWAQRSKDHQQNAKTTWRWLAATGSIFIALIILTMVVFGDAVAGTFSQEICSIGGDCAYRWSAKGPLTIGSILLIASLILWLLRTLNKFYLSSKHLASDAEERKAFVQTFLALREDEAVDEKHEAIVLSALFRPTQDGVVSDDNTPFDPSIVALLSRRIGN